MGRRPHDIEGFIALDYAICTWRLNNGFVMAIEELSLVVTAPTLDEAYRELERRKRDYFATMLELGRGHTISLPAGQTAARSFWHIAAPFTFKTLLVAIVVVVLAVSVPPILFHQLRDSARDIRNDVLRTDSMTPAQRDQIVAGIQDMLRALAPVIIEMRRILSQDIDPAPDGTAPKR